ncbi:hypothetical protein P4234_00150 [Pseudomonas aeruginosa]|nr:hypothetical protein [Pseudomonas aeruginosa]
MTGTEKLCSRGICELSKGGNQAIETRRIPLFQKDDGVPGLVQPGMLVRVDGRTGDLGRALPGHRYLG